MATATLDIHADVVEHKVSRHLYGHFAEHLGRCIYGGIWVGEKSRIPNDGGLRCDVIEALEELELPCLRWPGGCFADNYHWEDGIGPRGERPRRYNLWWKQPETNHFGTEEFIRFCRAIKTEPYICANVGSGSPQEAMNWLEYCNSSQDTAYTDLRRAQRADDPHRVIFWGVGNENWGCGGRMRPGYYADLYKRFATYMRGRGDVPIQLIACGSNPGLLDWDAVLLDQLRGQHNLIDALAIHHYTRGGPPRRQDTDFPDAEYYPFIADVEEIRRHLARSLALLEAHDAYGPPIKLIMDEWGTWYANAVVETGLFQQNTLRDALFTAASFEMFHTIGPRFHMANMAQTVNVLQALILTKGPEMIRTPTYHVYDLYRAHRDATKLCTVAASHTVEGPNGEQFDALKATASLGSEDGAGALTVVNLDPARDLEVAVTVSGAQSFHVESARILTAERVQDCNDFDASEKVVPDVWEVQADGCGFILQLPAKSIVSAELGMTV